jgi:hypothetical protein
MTNHEIHSQSNSNREECGVVTIAVWAALFGVGFLGTASSVFGEDKKSQPAQVTTTEHASFAPGGHIRIDASYGNLNVEGWDRPEIEMTVVKSMPYDYKPDDAAKHLEGVRIVAEAKSNTEMVISTTRRHRRGVSIEYQIHAPRSSNLVIHHGAGSVFVGDLLGDIEATCGRGDIVLMLRDSVAYLIDAKSKLGTVISDFEGNTHVNLYRLGERYATTNSSSARRIRLRIRFGGITITADPAEAFAPESMK